MSKIRSHPSTIHLSIHPPSRQCICLPTALTISPSKILLEPLWLEWGRKSEYIHRTLNWKIVVVVSVSNLMRLARRWKMWGIRSRNIMLIRDQKQKGETRDLKSSLWLIYIRSAGSYIFPKGLCWRLSYQTLVLLEGGGDYELESNGRI